MSTIVTMPNNGDRPPMYKVRRHLANGDYKGFWQVRNTEDGSVEYYPPSATIGVTGVKLRHQKGTAKKINEGANKAVCAWVECETYSVVHTEVNNGNKLEIVYNPRILPYWHSGFVNYDDVKFQSGNLTDGKFYV